MGLKIQFELDDADLEHFRLIMLHARDSVARRSPEDIVASASQLLEELTTSRTSGFIADRLHKLHLMTQMISDVEWRLPHAEVQRVLSALAYLSEPEDLIPDEIPGLGYLDDAIMIELVMRELVPEIESYEDFCEFREQNPNRTATATSKARDTLQVRMRERRQNDLRAGSAQPLNLLD